MTLFSNDNIIDAVKFCQNYLASLRLSKNDAVSHVRSKLVGDLSEIRRAASTFRMLVTDSRQIGRIKLNQEREVVDLWTNTILAEKEKTKGGKLKGPSDVGSATFDAVRPGRIFLAAGRLEAEPMPTEHPFCWVSRLTGPICPGCRTVRGRRT